MIHEVPTLKGDRPSSPFVFLFFCVRFQNPKQNVREDDDDEELAFLHIFGTVGTQSKVLSESPFSFFLSVDARRSAPSNDDNAGGEEEGGGGGGG